MTYDPFATDSSPVGGSDHKKRAFLIGNQQGRVHFLAKLTLYRGQSINCYHLIHKTRKKLEGRNTPNFEAIRDEFIHKGIEITYPNDIPESDVERWVEHGLSEAKRRGLEVGN